MLDTELFLNKNSCRTNLRVTIRNGAIVYESNADVFSYTLIRLILQFSNTICQGYPKGIPVHFLFRNRIQINDKLTYILFECICYQLIQRGHPVYIQIQPQCAISAHGIYSSPLGLLTTGKLSSVEKYIAKFQFEYFNLHFRRVFSNNSKECELSRLMDDVAIFQKVVDVKPDEREKISEVLVELVGNAKEHTSGDCLIDFDISSEYLKRGVDGKKYRGINLVILNFSDQLLGTALEEKLFRTEQLSERHHMVRKAYDMHEQYFDEQYLREDFFNIATFQHKISGRVNNYSTGGTGLTKLIHSLEEDSDAYECYVLSGQRKLMLQKEYIGYNEDQWIGFNDSNNFLEDPPNKQLLSTNAIYLPGTAFNLNFVMEVI